MRKDHLRGIRSLRTWFSNEERKNVNRKTLGSRKNRNDNRRIRSLRTRSSRRISNRRISNRRISRLYCIPQLNRGMVVTASFLTPL